MSSGTAPVNGLACDPGAIPAEERALHFSATRKLFGEQALERLEWDQGYAFRFVAEALPALARFVELERRCCRFITFELEVRAASGPVWLRMTGPGGTREVLDAAYATHSRTPAAAADVTGRDCGCAAPAPADQRLIAYTTIGGLLAALGVCAACCLIPAVLVALGFAGAWVSALDGLSAYKWAFVAAAAALLGSGHYRLYRRARSRSAATSAHTGTASDHRWRMALWATTALALTGIAYGCLEPWLSR
jgi:hypothetical protein